MAVCKCCIDSVIFSPWRATSQNLVTNCCFLCTPRRSSRSQCQENSQCRRYGPTHSNTSLGSYWASIFYDGETGFWYIQPRSTLLRLFGRRAWGWSRWSRRSRIVVVDTIIITIAGIITTVCVTCKDQKHWLDYVRTDNINWSMRGPKTLTGVSEAKAYKAAGKKYQLDYAKWKWTKRRAKKIRLYNVFPNSFWSLDAMPSFLLLRLQCLTVREVVPSSAMVQKGL